MKYVFPVNIQNKKIKKTSAEGKKETFYSDLHAIGLTLQDTQECSGISEHYGKTNDLMDQDIDSSCIQVLLGSDLYV